jgi:hypothetical protein
LKFSAWLSVLLILAIAWAVGRFFGGQSASSAMLDAISTLLGASSASLNSAPRLTILGLRLGCLILTAVYQTKLASILTVPVFETQLASPKDVSID